MPDRFLVFGSYKRVVGLAAVLLVTSAIATPYVPKDDAQSIEQLPFKPFDPAMRELQTLRLTLQQNPNNLPMAVKVARRYIEQSRANSDPRFLGYAQAALAPWWNLKEPPSEILLLRATIKQSLHNFDAALVDLAELLRRNPNDAQAWLTRATVLQVLGRYTEARNGCVALSPLVSTLVNTMCFAAVDSLNGQAEKSLALLTQLLARSPHISADEKIWVLTLTAEIAERLGRLTEAEKLFKEALALGVRDTYLMGAYADLLLDQGRGKEVVELLKGETFADGLLLRLALGEKISGEKNLAQSLSGHVEAIRSRFAASRLRGDHVHRREEARFVMAFYDQPQQALKLATDNWQVQREPWDVRVLLQAGLRAKDSKTINVVQTWIAQTRLEDVRVQTLLKRTTL